jgi:hypothetical protein
MNYVNFDLELFNYRDEHHIESFVVRVQHSPVGQQKLGDAEFVQLPVEVRSRQRLLDRRGLDTASMIAFGKMIGDALFPPTTRAFFERSRAKLREDEALRIRIKLDTHALSNVAWEYVYLSNAETSQEQPDTSGFLALDSRISLARYEVFGQAERPLAPMDGKLRFVGLLSNPASSDFPSLNLERERRVIEQSLQNVSAIQTEFQTNASVDDLLDVFAQPAQIFHFAGHGVFHGRPAAKFGSIEGKGFLVLQDENNHAVLFSADRLERALQGKDIRLAVLGACQSGMRDGNNAWTGVAAALIRAGIPAVVGMQFAVRDDSAITFNKQFYRTLAAGHSIDEAMTNGRIAVINKSQDDSERDWGVPVLYLRSESGILFPQVKREQAAAMSQQLAHEKPIMPLSSFQTATLREPFVGGRVSELPSKVALREFIITKFNEEDLDALCQNLSEALPEPVDIEKVGGKGRGAKVLNLIEWADRRDWYSELVEGVRKVRGGI